MALSIFGINTPLFSDTALTILPFFAFGYTIGRRTNFLSERKSSWYELFFIIFLFALVYFFAAPLDYATNRFSNKAFYTCYVCGIFGTIAILLISRRIGILNPISYWGRYSIIVLCTHIPVLHAMKFVIMRFFGCDNNLLMIIIFVVVMMAELLIIPFCKKFLPYVTAQKDVICINK